MIKANYKQVKYVLLILVLFTVTAYGQSRNNFVPSGSTWKYLDDGSDQDTLWRETGFDDIGWAEGAAQLGYGDGDENTIISYGPDEDNKYVTTYFRHEFDVDDYTAIEALKFKLLRDDGAVVYLNGVEVVRSNMPEGDIDYITLASKPISSIYESRYYEYLVNAEYLKDGSNILAVEVHIFTPTTYNNDLSFDLELVEDVLVKKAPYLIYPGENTKMQVLWQLKANLACTIDWGLDINYSLGTTETAEYGDDHQHIFEFTNLTPGTKYYYRVNANKNSYLGSFKAAPSDDESKIKFYAYGDTRSYPADHNKVAEAIINSYTVSEDKQTMIIAVGDYVNDGNSEGDWDEQFFSFEYSNIQKMLATLPYQGAMGNHEGSGVLYEKYFPYPYTSNRYWSFDYGPAHFVIVDQYVDYFEGSIQHNWIKNDLESTNKSWKFIYLHEPGWSADGGHSNDTTVQNHIQPLCEEYDIPIVFAGHNHYYSRADVNGIQHITTGGGGAPLRTPDSNFPNIIITKSVHHFCEIEIDNDQLNFVAIASNGEIIDSFTVNNVTNIEQQQLPNEFRLFQAYPNPFNPSTTIKYEIPSVKNVRQLTDAPSLQNVTLKVYDVLGREVATLVNEQQQPGSYEIVFNVEDISSGIYFYRLISGNFSQVRKMIFMK